MGDKHEERKRFPTATASATVTATDSAPIFGKL